MSNLRSERVLEYQVISSDIDECIEMVGGMIHRNFAATPIWMACLNPNSYVTAINDYRFADALHSADLLLPDGIGIVIASRIAGGSIARRITGYDFFEGLHRKLDESNGVSIFLLGSSEHTLSLLREKLAASHKNVRVAGVYSPPFLDTFPIEETEKMIAKINLSGADILWVALTAPKQEKWVADNISRLNVKFAGCVGAVFDFYAGTIVRSPRFFRAIGLEWLPRLAQEPKRLWRRTFISGSIFAFRAIKFAIGI